MPGCSSRTPRCRSASSRTWSRFGIRGASTASCATSRAGAGWWTSSTARTSSPHAWSSTTTCGGRPRPSTTSSSTGTESARSCPSGPTARSSHSTSRRWTPTGGRSGTARGTWWWAPGSAPGCPRGSRHHRASGTAPSCCTGWTQPPDRTRRASWWSAPVRARPRSPPTCTAGSPRPRSTRSCPGTATASRTTHRSPTGCSILRRSTSSSTRRRRSRRSSTSTTAIPTTRSWTLRSSTSSTGVPTRSRSVARPGSMCGR